MKSRTDILSLAPATDWQTLGIPEWDGAYRIRPLPGAVAEEIQLLVEQAVSTGDYTCLQGLRARVAIAVVCDGDGNALFKPSDADALTANHLPVLQRIFDHVKGQLSFTKAEQEALGND